jgi:hypothetical protein
MKTSRDPVQVSNRSEIYLERGEQLDFREGDPLRNCEALELILQQPLDVRPFKESGSDPGYWQALRKFADEEAGYVGLDEIPIDEVVDLSVDPDSDEGVVRRVDSSRVAALTLMRRLRQPVHEGHPGLFLLDSSLTLSQGVHGSIEGMQIPKPFDVRSSRKDRSFVEETVVSDA